MDRAITAREANQHFSRLLREVAGGARYVVTSRGRPVARVLPVDDDVERRRVTELLAFARSLPARQASAWTRDELYD